MLSSPRVIRSNEEHGVVAIGVIECEYMYSGSRADINNYNQDSMTRRYERINENDIDGGQENLSGDRTWKIHNAVTKVFPERNKRKFLLIRHPSFSHVGVFKIILVARIASPFAPVDSSKN